MCHDLEKGLGVGVRHPLPFRLLGEYLAEGAGRFVVLVAELVEGAADTESLHVVAQHRELPFLKPAHVAVWIENHAPRVGDTEGRMPYRASGVAQGGSEYGSGW